MSASQKHNNFVSEPLGNKPVTALPGIGPKLGQSLERKGYEQASQVVGQYMAMGKQEAKFSGWLQTKTPANTRQARECTKGVAEYCDYNT